MILPTIFTAMVTPFAQDGSLDVATSARLARWLSDHGSGGLVVAGTTGESPTLSVDERARLFHAVKGAVGSIPVWMGCGSNDTWTTRQRVRDASDWGADGVMLVTPYYNKPPQEGLYQHFVAAAQESRLPVMIYNVPARTGVSLEPETLCQIAQTCDNVVAIKQAAGSIQALASMVEACSHVRVYAGDDALFYDGLGVGVEGVVSVASHVVGLPMSEMVHAFRTNDFVRAERLHQLLLPLMQSLFTWPNPVPVKWLMNRLGFSVGPVRLPLVYPRDTTALDLLYAQYRQLSGDLSVDAGSRPCPNDALSAAEPSPEQAANQPYAHG